jgi:hypothetical protein
METVGAHGLDVRRPLVDEHDVEPGIGEVGRDAASVGAGAENCDFLVHRARSAGDDPALCEILARLKKYRRFTGRKSAKIQYKSL